MESESKQLTAATEYPARYIGPVSADSATRLWRRLTDLPRVVKRMYGGATRQRRQAMRMPERVEMLQLGVRATDTRVAQLQAVLAELEARLNRHISGARAGVPLNLTMRGQVARMARNGQRPEQIAGTLGVPLGEVLLLLKLERRAQSGASRNWPATD